MVGTAGNIGMAFVSTDRDAEHHQLAFVQVKPNDDPPNSVGHLAFRVATLDEVRAVHSFVTADARASDVRVRSSLTDDRDNGSPDPVRHHRVRPRCSAALRSTPLLCQA